MLSSFRWKLCQVLNYFLEATTTTTTTVENHERDRKVHCSYMLVAQLFPLAFELLCTSSLPNFESSYGFCAQLSMYLGWLDCHIVTSLRASGLPESLKHLSLRQITKPSLSVFGYLTCWQVRTTILFGGGKTWKVWSHLCVSLCWNYSFWLSFDFCQHKCGRAVRSSRIQRSTCLLVPLTQGGHSIWDATKWSWLCKTNLLKVNSFDLWKYSNFTFSTRFVPSKVFTTFGLLTRTHRSHRDTEDKVPSLTFT